jgi:hypothetical protein
MIIQPHATLQAYSDLVVPLLFKYDPSVQLCVYFSKSPEYQNFPYDSCSFLNGTTPNVDILTRDS